MSYNNSDDGGGGGGTPTHSSTITWKGHSYTFQLFHERFSIHVSVKQNKEEEVGYLDGYLLQRPSPYFFEFADEASQELQELACIFCNPIGIANRVKHPKLTTTTTTTTTTTAAAAVRGGGFLNIDTIEIKPTLQGMDLGLRIIHETLVALQDKWTLAVMMPCALGRHACHWKENSRLVVLDDNVGRRELTPEQQRQACEENDKKVTRHLARMGFVQAGAKSNQVPAWFLTADMYFQNDSTTRNLSAGHPETLWLNKQQAKAIEILEPPKKVEKTGLNKELYDAVVAFPSEMMAAVGFMLALPAAAAANVQEDHHLAEKQAAAIRTMEDLVRRGASVNDSGALQSAAANNNIKNTIVLQTLLRLGGNVNHRDEFGNTPLHVAAACQRYEAIEYLLSVGADSKATNHDGETPMQCFQNTLQGFEDMGAAFGFGSMPVREIDVVPKLKCSHALMPPSQRALLIDGWMPPRMKALLMITAELEMEHILNNDDVRFTSREATPLSECCSKWFGITRVDYIPTSVFTSPVNQNGLYKSFNDGWGFVWMAIWAVLRDGHTPTVSRVEHYLENSVRLDFPYDARMYRHYLSKGGKVEFAIDALINITRNVMVTGDDGYEYVTFQDDIEMLPATPLDEAFDIARFKCINQGGGEGTMRGPYNHDKICGDDDDDDEDEEEDNFMDERDS